MSPEQILAALGGQLPPALLLTGPGAWAAGTRLHDGRKSPWNAMVRILDAESARWVRGQAFILPAGGAPKVFLVCLDGATDQAQHILLKVLEEPPPTVRFILAGTRLPLGTIVSRCRMLVIGPAPQEDQEDPGRVKARQEVAAAVRAARDGHAQVLETVLRGWTAGHTGLLQAWAAEAAAGDWREFSGQYAPGVTARQALAVLAVLAAYEGARTAAAVALGRAFLR